MKSLFTTVAILATISAVSPAFAQEGSQLDVLATPYGTISVTDVSGDCTFWSQYHGSNGSVFDPDASLQCSATVSVNDGWYGNLWVAADSKDGWMGGSEDVVDFGDEIDLTGGKTGTLAEVDYDIGVSYFYIDSPTADDGDVIQLYAKLSKSFTWGDTTVTPYVKLEQYLPTNGDLPLDGRMVRIGADVGGPLFGDFSYSVGGEIFHDDGAFGFDPGVLAFLNGKVAFATSDRSSVAVLVKYSTPISGAEGRQEELSFAAQVATKF